jgi:hypothetical protein
MERSTITPMSIARMPLGARATRLSIAEVFIAVDDIAAAQVLQ